MPELFPEQGTGDVARLHAVMSFPDESELREIYYAVYLMHNRIADLDDDELVSLTAFELEQLITAPSMKELRRQAIRNTKKGILAGIVLASLYVMQRFDVNEPSLNKAIHVAQMYAPDTTYGDGSQMRYSERAIKESWRQFKSVAHLWAAAELNKAYPYSEPGNIFSKESLPMTLGVAAAILDFGCDFVPYRAKPRAPVLKRSECWTLPSGIESVHLNSSRIPDRLLKMLETYKAPSSPI